MTIIQACVVLAAITVAAISIWLRDKNLFASYAARRTLYRDWIVLYGEERKSEIQTFLRCFGDAFLFPAELLHKLGPNDGVMEFYHRRNKNSVGDAMETEFFVRDLRKLFRYEAREEDGALTLSQLFERVTNCKRK